MTAWRVRLMPRVLVAILTIGSTLGIAEAQLRLADESDRAAFRAWYVFLADAQFYRTTADVDDCAALVRYAYREALRPHTPEWVRLARLPLTPAYPDVRHRPTGSADGWPLFKVSDDASAPLAEFANARTIIGYNTRLVSRDAHALRPGHLIYFRQPHQDSPDHLMVFVGRSLFEPEGVDWIVYHTGPSDPHPSVRSTDDAAAPDRASQANAGEVRKVRLADLLRHPSPHWRPVPDNPNFVGIFALSVQ